MRIESYDVRHRAAWDRFVAESKNGTFLFQRDYMDYHADRFQDASLLFYEDDELIALLPATRHGEEIVSHGGLTYGGVVSAAGMRASVMLAVFDELTSHLRRSGIRALTYKAVPHIYHSLPAEEDLYALFRHDAVLYRRDLSATVPLRRRPAYSKGRKHAVKRGRQQTFVIARSHAFQAFMELENSHLLSRHGVSAVHTAEEMELLASRFPDNIQLFTATLGDRLLAGVLIYLTTEVAHAQYIASTDEGRALCAPDAILDALLAGQFPTQQYFDFGVSTEQQGRVLNAGLIQNKESYGGRSTVYDFYRLDLL